MILESICSHSFSDEKLVIFSHRPHIGLNNILSQFGAFHRMFSKALLYSFLKLSIREYVAKNIQPSRFQENSYEFIRVN